MTLIWPVQVTSVDHKAQKVMEDELVVPNVGKVAALPGSGVVGFIQSSRGLRPHDYTTVRCALRQTMH